MNYSYWYSAVVNKVYHNSLVLYSQTPVIHVYCRSFDCSSIKMTRIFKRTFAPLGLLKKFPILNTLYTCIRSLSLVLRSKMHRKYVIVK